MDVDAYRVQAETFLTEIDGEYYRHFSGRQDDFAIESIYDRHAALFSREAVERLRESGSCELLAFAAEGLIGQATKAEAAELARREATLEVEVDGGRMPYRQATVAQANEPEPGRRAALEAARLALIEEHLNPLTRSAFERSQTLARELGWGSVRAMCQELSGIDLAALGRQTEAFLSATDEAYAGIVEPRLRDQLGFGFDRARRSDLPAFFRAPSLDALFPADRLVSSLVDTLAGMGIDLDAQPNVVLDTEARAKKSPRAFCAPVRVPDEVYLVITRVGGRDDFEALFHEAGHTEHYAHVERGLVFEHRYLGDNSVTEGFAFLMQHLTEDPAWLRQVLGAEEVDELLAHARASKLVFLRRYAAKLLYELDLQDAPESLEPMPTRYSERLSRAVGLEWPPQTWLGDVDPFFYVARYLRAWALETHLRRILRGRFGETWFAEPEAGDLLRSLWREGQRLPADDLLGELSGARLDFSALLEDLALTG